MLAGAVVVGVEEAIPVFSQAPAASDPVVAAPVEDKAAVAPQRPTTPVATAAISASADPPIAAVSVHVAAPSAPTSPPVATVEAPPLESATAPKPEARTLVLEIAALDRVKRALVAGNMTSALEELNNYERDFPRGVMSPEAKAMRIEALARGGKKAEARAMLAAFRARHPDSPLLESLSRVVGE
jgi:TolA-binding protein